MMWLQEFVSATFVLDQKKCTMVSYICHDIGSIVQGATSVTISILLQRDANCYTSYFHSVSGPQELFNYDIIEHIIAVLGAGEDKANLQSYNTAFAK